ncbi:MAG: ribonuclease III [Lentisphaeria bacterium]
MKYLLHELEDKLGYRFSNLDLLKRALTHPSYAAERRSSPAHNQRLEFFGDAVLQIVVTELLFYAHPDLQEGALSKLRSAVTNEDALVHFAHDIELGKYLFLGKGEEQSGGRDRISNLADAMEAVLGALYLDGGMKVVKRFLNRQIDHIISKPQVLLRTENPKGALQELAQHMYQKAPEYEVVKVTGPEHAPEFEVTVALDNETVARATARSRKKAEKNAAFKALEELTEKRSAEKTKSHPK